VQQNLLKTKFLIIKDKTLVHNVRPFKAVRIAYPRHSQME